MTGHLAPLAQAPDHLEAVEVGQTEIDDDDVGLAGGHLDQTVGGGPRLEEPVALAREGRAQEAPDLRLVLDQDHDGLRHRPDSEGARPAAA